MPTENNRKIKNFRGVFYLLFFDIFCPALPFCRHKTELLIKKLRQSRVFCPRCQAQRTFFKTNKKPLLLR
jgi:hypothetical protein